ncbi:MAG: hypothetical protein QM723_34815 [Myxococcaceae bacterium]
MLGVLLTVLAVGEPQVLESRAGVETRTAGYAASDYVRGSYVSVSPWVVFPLAKGLWASVEAPMEWARSPFQEVYGLGDVRSALGWRVVQREEWALDVALAESWPVGDSHQGLGSAQLRLEPTVAGQVRFGRWYARSSAALRWAIAWGVHGEHGHLSYADPYDVLDVALRFEGGAWVTPWLAVVAVLEPTLAVVLAPVWPVGSRAVAGGGARVEAGAFFGEAMTLMPVTRNAYELWQIRVSAGARF